MTKQRAPEPATGKKSSRRSGRDLEDSVRGGIRQAARAQPVSSGKVRQPQGSAEAASQPKERSGRCSQARQSRFAKGSGNVAETSRLDALVRTLLNKALAGDAKVIPHLIALIRLAGLAGDEAEGRGCNTRSGVRTRRSSGTFSVALGAAHPRRGEPGRWRYR